MPHLFDWMSLARLPFAAGNFLRGINSFGRALFQGTIRASGTMSAEAKPGIAEQQADAVLVARIAGGDRTAEEALLAKYRRGVFVIAYARTRDREAAQDLAQEILIAVLKSLRAGSVREPEKLPAFIQGTARNVINHYLGSLARRAESDLSEAELKTTDPVEQMEWAERQRMLSAELKRCDLVDQQILLLSLVDGHSLAEVARRLELSHDAVRARKSRLIRKITGRLAAMSQ